MKNLLFKKKVIIISALCAMIVCALFIVKFTGMLNSKASVNLVNYGNADNNNHSSEQSYVIASATSENAIKYSADTIQDGVILQAWCWSFNTIKEHIPEIQAAGYTSVQTSPINKCRIGYNNNDYNMHLSNWYYHYQPTNYTIGNYQLGTEEEFIEMCKVAHQYGIKVIVDAVVNHMTSEYNIIDWEWRNRNYFHEKGNVNIYDWESRYGLTQFALAGLWDLNTQNTEVQRKIKDYLSKCVKDGADGFRYDAAKHIELPNDYGFGSDFWPCVLDNGATFQYGENIGPAHQTKAESYTPYMSIVNDSYGSVLRNAVTSCNFNAGKMMNYNINFDTDHLVSWVESHDTYSNGERETTWLTDEQITLCWSVLAARKASTPLFYDRPVGGGGTSYDNRFPGLNKIGEEGSSLYKSPTISAVNIFRNEMEGENEYLRNIDNDSIIMIERGNKGAVIVNSGYYPVSFNSATNMTNGSYKDHTLANGTFTVNNKNLSGTIGARSVAVIYNSSADEAPVVGISGYSKKVTNLFTSDYLPLQLNADNYKNATYSINDGTSYLYNSGKEIYIGWGVADNTVIKVELKAENNNGIAISATYFFEKKAKDSVLYVNFEKPSNWSDNVNAYIYNSNKNFASWPGTPMAKVDGNSYQLSILAADFIDGYIIFNDDSNQIPGSGCEGFKLVNYGYYDSNGLKKTVSPTSLPVATAPADVQTVIPTTEAPTYTEVPVHTDDSNTNDASEISVKFEKPSGWSSDIYAYVYSEVGSKVDMIEKWPGQKMTNESDNVYSLSFSKDYTNARIIFTDNKNQVPASGQAGFNIAANGYYTVEGLKYVDDSNVTPAPTVHPTAVPTVKPEDLIIPVTTPSPDEAVEEYKIYYYTSWESPNVHYTLDNNNWTNVPGVKMSKSDVSGYYVVTIEAKESQAITCCFNNNGSSWDSHEGQNYKMNKPDVYTIKNGVITNGSPK